MSIENIYQEPKKRGRPRKEDPENSETKNEKPSELVSKIQVFLNKANMSLRELIAESNLNESFFAPNCYNLNKAAINRITVVLAQKIDERYGTKDNPFPASDYIDSLLNELLNAAGINAAHNPYEDNVWLKIEKTRVWTLGYTSNPSISEHGGEHGEKPIGRAVEYSKWVSELLEFRIKWVRLEPTDISSAIKNKIVDAVCPSEPAVMSNIFDYNFSDPCSDEKHKVAPLIPVHLSEKYNKFIDIPIDQVELLYIPGSLGEVGVKYLSKNYKSKAFQTVNKCMAYLNSSVERQTSIIPVFFHDTFTANY